jgi:hypothetical protein
VTFLRDGPQVTFLRDGEWELTKLIIEIFVI